MVQRLRVEAQLLTHWMDFGLGNIDHLLLSLRLYLPLSLCDPDPRVTLTTFETTLVFISFVNLCTSKSLLLDFSRRSTFVSSFTAGVSHFLLRFVFLLFFSSSPLRHASHSFQMIITQQTCEEVEACRRSPS